jgi:hypothetical protein
MMPLPIRAKLLTCCLLTKNLRYATYLRKKLLR